MFEKCFLSDICSVLWKISPNERGKADIFDSNKKDAAGCFNPNERDYAGNFDPNESDKAGCFNPNERDETGNFDPNAKDEAGYFNQAEANIPQSEAYKWQK